MRIILTILLVALGSTAEAQLMHGVTDSLSGGGTPIPPVCSNALDFSQACNSQYLLIVGM